MRGSVDYQINRLFAESGIFRPGTSRHQEKQQARQVLAQAELAATSTRLAEQTGLHSYTYARDCKDTWHRFGAFAKQRHTVKDMTRLSGVQAEAYLLQRIQDGISYATWKKEAAHVGKLENAILAWYRNHNLEPDTLPGIRIAALDMELRTLARESLARGGKEFGHFLHPEMVLAQLETASRTEFPLVARLQHEGGARCREACRITQEQMLGMTSDSFTQELRGQIHLTDTKGGKPRTIQVNPETYQALEGFFGIHGGILHIPMGSYAASVRGAARSCGEPISGTHAFRYCFARRRYKELMARAGLSHEAALQQVSWEMGHERADITLLYLR